MSRVPRLPNRIRVRRDALLLRLVMASAGRAVTRPVRFALNELAARRGVRRYRLRGSGHEVVLRHPASDAWVVHEVLVRGVYLPPPDVASALGAADGPLRIADLGAHVGSSTLSLLGAYPEASVVAYEPNPETAALLRRTLAANGLEHRVALREAAAGTEAGVAEMEGFSLLSHLVRDRPEQEAEDLVPAIRALQQDGARHRVEVRDALPDVVDADLVKLDIEGGEWPILADPRFPGPRLRALVLEYHPQGAPGEDATAAVVELLEQAGLRVGEPFDQHHGVGLVWAWRP